MLCAQKGGKVDAKNSGRFLLREHHTQRKRDENQFQFAPAVNRAARCEGQLTERIGGAEQVLLSALVKAQREIDSITALENFILGFRLGIRMMAECMDNNDGEIREVTDYG